MTVRDCLVVVIVVLLPLGALLIHAEILRRRDRRWRDSSPTVGGRLSGRSRS